MIPLRLAQAMATVRRAEEALLALHALDPDYERPWQWAKVRDFIADVRAAAEAEIQSSAYRTTPWD